MRRAGPPGDAADATPVEADGAAKAMSLRTFLSLARTGWTIENVEHVLVKLQKVGVRDLPAMLPYLCAEEKLHDLNERLRKAGFKGFSVSTLQALQAQRHELVGRSADGGQKQAPQQAPQVSPKVGSEGQGKLVVVKESADIQHRPSAAENRWRVVHEPGVWIRSSPLIGSERLGFLRVNTNFEGTGKTAGFEVGALNEEGGLGKGVWVQHAGGGWVLTEGARIGLGTLCVCDAGPGEAELEASVLEAQLSRGSSVPECAATAATAVSSQPGIRFEPGDRVKAFVDGKWCPALVVATMAGDQFCVCTVDDNEHHVHRRDLEREEGAVPQAGAEDGSTSLQLRSGDTVFLRDHRGRHLQVEGGETDHGLLVVGHERRGVWEQLRIERRHGIGPVCSGDPVSVRAFTGALLALDGGAVRARGGGAGDAQLWVIEKRGGSSSALSTGDMVYLRAYDGNTLATHPRVHAGTTMEGFTIERRVRRTDAPDWDAPAPAGWWRVLHRPSVWVHGWMNRGATMLAAHCTDTVLAMDERCVGEGGDLWLRLRDSEEATQQWVRVQAPDEGFCELLVPVETEDGLPSPEDRAQHGRVIEALNWAKEQCIEITAKMLASRETLPLQLQFTKFVGDFISDVMSADRVATYGRTIGYPTAPYACQVAQALHDEGAGGTLARRLLRDGYVVVDNAVPSSCIAELIEQAERLDSGGLLHEPDQPTPGQRGDRILWVDEYMTKHRHSAYFAPAISSTVQLLKGVAHALNPALSRYSAEQHAASNPAYAAPPQFPATAESVLLVAPKAMLASYPGAGAHYIAHQDNMYRHMTGKRSNPRELTAIVYANPPDWDPKRDGGELKVYLRSEQLVETPAKKDFGYHETVNIAPYGGRLVVFFSALWHEVQAAYRHRRAVTLWIFRPCVE